MTEVPLGTGERALLNAIAAIGSDLELHRVLERIVQAACSLTSARYGALGVLGPDGQLADFITHGIDVDTQREIGELPRGRGILGLLIDHPEPIRLARLQDHPATFGFPPRHPPMTSFLGVPVRIRGTVFGNLYLTEKRSDGTTAPGFTAEDEERVTALAATAGFVIENARAYDRSERQRVWLEAAAELQAGLQSPSGPPAATQRVAAAFRAAGALDAVGVYRATPSGALEMVGSDGRHVSLLPELTDRLRGSLARVGQAGVVEEMQVSGDVRAVILPVPTRLNRGLVVLGLVKTTYADTSLPVLDRELLSSFAEQVALTLDRVQALADRAELAVVTDRERIARDLHDLVIQRLFATGLRLQGLRRRASDPLVVDRVDEAVAALDETITEIRATIFELHGRATETVRGALVGLLGEYDAALGFTPTLRLHGPVGTVADPEVREHLLAVVRESLSNIARHAHATAAEVSVAIDGDELVATVTDDGVGPPDRLRESGLRNLRQRAGALGGQVRLARAEPRGTLLEWRVPFSSSPGR